MASDASTANDHGDAHGLQGGPPIRHGQPPVSPDDACDAAEIAARRKLSFGAAPPDAAPANSGSVVRLGEVDAGAESLRGEPALALVMPTAPRGDTLGHDDTRGLRQGLSSIFEHVDSLLRDVERAKAALAQRTASLTAERDAHHDTKSRHRLLSMEQERLNGDMRALSTELDRQSGLATELENTVANLQHTLADKTRALADHARRAESGREKHVASQEDLRLARAELATAEDRVFAIEAELATTRDALTLTEAHNGEQHAELGELRQLAHRRAQASEEACVLLAATQTRLQDADAALDAERAELARLHSLLQQETDGRRAELAGMQLKSDSLAARAEAMGRQHGEARAELDGSLQAHQLLETLLREQTALAARAQDDLLTAETRVEQLSNQIQDLEGANRALTEHTEGLTLSVRTREKEGSNWQQKIEAANERLRMETQRFEADRDSLGHAVAQLTAQLEQEKLARALAEGALDAARKERLAQSRAAPYVRLVSSQPEPALTGTHGANNG